MNEQLISEWIDAVIKASGNQAGSILSQLHQKARDAHVSQIIAWCNGRDSDLEFSRLKCDLLSQALQKYISLY